MSLSSAGCTCYFYVIRYRLPSPFGWVIALPLQVSQDTHCDQRGELVGKSLRKPVFF